MVSDIYDLRPGEGIGNHLGEYMPRIWQFQEAVISFFPPEKEELNRIATIFQLREIYKTSYEFTIKFLTEFAYQIALEKVKSNDKSSISFVKNYEDAAIKKGGKPLKRDLILFLRQQKYLIGECTFLQNSIIRDSICHENVYYDEKNKLLVFGNKKISFEEFKKYFEEMYKINQFLDSAHLERGDREIEKKDLEIIDVNVKNLQ